MKLNEIENILKIKFPARFHKIYETGAMEWLEISREEFNKNSDKYKNDPKAFLMLWCDCEPYPFADIPEAVNHLDELIKMQEEDEEVSLKENIRLVPFGHSNGDVYCFLYEYDNSEPKVIRYFHDEYGDPEIAGNDFDEFLYNIILNSVSYESDDGNDEYIYSEPFKEHIKYLSEKYRRLIEGKSQDELLDDFDAIIYGEAEIWE